MISIIVITYNEEQKIGKLLDNLHQLPHTHGKEIIISDGGSSDNTIEAINNRARIIIGKKGKAFQMNKAAQAAWGNILLFVHADMHLPFNTLLAVEEVIYKEKFDGGGFTNRFDQHNNKIKRISTIMNAWFFDKKEQADRGIFYGDNAIFISKSAFQTLGGFKEMLIMEDFDFSKRASLQFKLKKISNPVIIVSARRHIQSGFFKTQFLCIIIRLLYKLGISPSTLAKWYTPIR